MSIQSEKILSDVLELTPEERAELIEKVIQSFESPERKKIDSLWAKEVEERIEAYERGEIKSIPSDEVYDDIE